MALENPNFISDLDQAAPAFQDQRSEGDDHLRAIKKAIVATFPGFNGRIYRKRSMDASGPLALTDNGALIRADGTLTLTPAAAGSLGNWACWVRAGAGTITIDPTGSEKVNGVLTADIPTGYTGMLFCDGVEFYLFIAYSAVPANTPSFPSGTRMLFQQTSAPAGWTKVTSATYNDASLRLTTGTVATGGVTAFTSVFGSSKVTGSTALSTGQMPPHVHTGGRDGNGAGVGAGWGVDVADVLSHYVDTGSTGGGGSHNHTLSLDVKYADVIIATKD